ncbi:MAG: hypothetical protein ABW044_05210 [Cellvibrio sp.]
MRKVWVISVASVLVILSVAVLLQVKSETKVVTAEYLMLACEDCNHMQITHSDDPDDIGKTIIPVSDVVDIEQLIDTIALSKESVCLVGQFYKVNLNFVPINPSGYKFEVLEVKNKGKCIRK